MVDEEFREHMRPRKGKEPAVTGNMKSVDPLPKPKKKKKWWLAVLILILLLAGAAAALYFSGMLQSWLNQNAEQTAAQDQAAQMETTKQELDAKQQELDARESELNKRESEIKDRESNLDAMEQANMSFREYQDSLNPEDLASIKQVSMIYSKMEAASAAEVIAQMTDRKRAALILYNMSASAAAAVMNAMTPEQAVEITGILTQ